MKEPRKSDTREVRPSRRRPPRGGLSAGTITTFALLLVFPVLALLQLSRSADLRIVLGAWVVICGGTWVLYRRDKQKAEAGEWRIPEMTLHLAELAGGWPAAFLAQRKLRHKIAKTSYQVVFVSIVVLHQLVAFDFLIDWRLLRAGLAAAQSALPEAPAR